MKTLGLDSRMKDYEYVSRIYLPKRMPVIIRLDGKAFHTFTKNFDKPFDTIFMKAMQKTAEYLCKNIMNCKLAYTQSDEISLLLINYDTITSESWFGNNIQKMASVSASMATLTFNKAFSEVVQDFGYDCCDGFGAEVKKEREKDFERYKEVYLNRINTAMFDSRVFVLPQDEVCNYFIWRQQDSTKNSIQMVAQSLFPQNEIQSLNQNQLQEKMWQEKNVNWNDFQTAMKRGSCVVKQLSQEKQSLGRWIVDIEIPIFTADRNYIDNFVFPIQKEDSK